MWQEDPLLSKIEEEKQFIKDEVSLKKKRKKYNRIVIVTSLILLSGIIIGLIRILLLIF